MYYNGQGTDKDYKKAFYQNQRAADLGYTFGIDNLIYLYQNGIGTPKDLEKVKYWEQQKITLVKQEKVKQERLAGYKLKESNCDKILNEIKEEDERIRIEIEENKKSKNHIDHLQQSLDDYDKTLKNEYGAYTNGKGVLILRQIDISNPKYFGYRDICGYRQQVFDSINYAISNYNNRNDLINNRVSINSKKSDDYNKDCGNR